MDRRYRTYAIKTGRIIQEPLPELKALQKRLINLYSKFPYSNAAHGGIFGRSTITCASEHTGASFILKMDISRFYPNTYQSKVEEEICELRYDCDNLRHNWLINLPHCMIKTKRGVVLPTGGPTSPLLSNIACTTLDSQLEKLAKSESEHLGCKVIFTRYFDDIIFSIHGPERRWDLLKDIAGMIKDNGYRVNHKKSKWMTVNIDNLKIVGIIQRSDGILRIPKKLRMALRSTLFNLAFSGQVITEEVNGLLSYVYSINKEQYHQLVEHYQRCVQTSSQKDSTVII